MFHYTFINNYKSWLLNLIFKLNGIPSSLLHSFRQNEAMSISFVVWKEELISTPWVMLTVEPHIHAINKSKSAGRKSAQINQQKLTHIFIYCAHGNGVMLTGTDIYHLSLCSSSFSTLIKSEKEKSQVHKFLVSVLPLLWIMGKCKPALSDDVYAVLSLHKTGHYEENITIKTDSSVKSVRWLVIRIPNCD